jgi:hypothetical protein
VPEGPLVFPREGCIENALSEITDASRVRSILSQAAFGSVTISPFDTLIGSEDIEQALRLALRLGPLGRLLREQPPVETQSQFEILY